MMVSHSLYWTLWMLSCFGQCLSQDLQIPELINKLVGETVVFSLDKPPSGTINLIQWEFESEFIITAVSGTVVTHPLYEDRVDFNINTFSLELQNLRLNDSGIYTLSVRNSAGNTNKGQTSLQVFEKIYNVKLSGPVGSLIEGNSSANITSEGNGTITSVQWMKDKKPLSPSTSIIISSDNRSVFISPVQRSDSGEYQCTYSNPVSSETVNLSLIISYGPDDVSIKGDDVVDLGVRVSLSCSANSQPSASFSWKFNESDTGVTTDTFIIDQTNFTDSGEYECTAFNSVTKKSATKKHALLVKAGGGGGGEGGGRGGGLTSGAIAGIVIGVLVAVAAVCGLIVYLTKTKKIPKISIPKSGPARGGAQTRQDAEVNYADVSHFQKSSGERVNLGNSDTATQYAEIRHGGKSKAPPPPYGSQVSK